MRWRSTQGEVSGVLKEAGMEGARASWTDENAWPGVKAELCDEDAL